MEALKSYLPINTIEKVDQLIFDLENTLSLGLTSFEDIELRVLCAIKKVKIQLYWKEQLNIHKDPISRFQFVKKTKGVKGKTVQEKFVKKINEVKSKPPQREFYPKSKERLLARTKNEVLFSPNQLVGLTLSEVAEITKVDISIYYELIGVTSPDFVFRLKDFNNLKHKLAKLYKQEIMSQLAEKSKETEKDFDYAKRGRSKTTMGIPGNYFKLILLRNKQ